MRVFDSYYFNIADKVKFKDTKPYLDHMLTETGYSYKNIAFQLSDVYMDTVKKVLTKLPSLEKYEFRSECGLTSFRDNWYEGAVHADPEDWEDISLLFSKIPRTYNFSFGKLILDGINWFEDSDDSIAVDYEHFQNGIPVNHVPPFYSNRIWQLRMFDDGNKLNRIYVNIEVTGEMDRQDELKNSHAVIQKLVPYLGEPEDRYRRCFFSKDEVDELKRLTKQYRDELNARMNAELPISKKMILGSDIPHVADKFIVDKVFKGTEFKRQKEQPNWLQVYSCVDQHGFRYTANIQKISIGNAFHFWLTISGYNFVVEIQHEEYYVEREGESHDILVEIVKFCKNVKEDYGEKLAGDFGDTPAWYRQI